MSTLYYIVDIDYKLDDFEVNVAQYRDDFLYVSDYDNVDDIDELDENSSNNPQDVSELHLNDIIVEYMDFTFAYRQEIDEPVILVVNNDRTIMFGTKQEINDYINDKNGTNAIDEDIMDELESINECWSVF